MFLITKRGQILNLTTFFSPARQKFTYYSVFSIFFNIYFKVRSHGFDGLFGAFDVACSSTTSRGVFEDFCVRFLIIHNLWKSFELIHLLEVYQFYKNLIKLKILFRLYNDSKPNTLLHKYFYNFTT